MSLGAEGKDWGEFVFRHLGTGSGRIMGFAEGPVVRFQCTFEVEVKGRGPSFIKLLVRKVRSSLSRKFSLIRIFIPGRRVSSVVFSQTSLSRVKYKL